MALNVTATRAEALFCSTRQPSEHPSAVQVGESIAAMIRVHGSHGCACQVAREYGDHPETAVQRMAWARYMVAVAYPPRHRHTKRYPWCQRCWYTPERVAAIHVQVRQAKAAARNEAPPQPMTVDEILAAVGSRARS